MADTPAAVQLERRQDAGYLTRLIEETHRDARKTRECIFEGNGEPALIVQIANIKSGQTQQRTEIDAVRKDLNDQMAAMIGVQKTLLLITGLFSKVGVTLLCAIVLAILGVIAGLITHQIPWFTP